MKDLDALLKADSVFISKKLITQIGSRPAIFLSYLIDKQKSLSIEGNIGEDESFYWSNKEIEKELGWKKGVRTSVTNKLIEVNLISLIKEELSGKVFYKINNDLIRIEN